jgi:alpha-amylase
MENGVILQPYHWYSPADHSLWNTLAADAPSLAARGYTAVWLPPPYKGQSSHDVGYGVYDLFDLGEFPQKGATATKYGTRAELIAAVHALQAAGLHVYADVVFNHKDGGDRTEEMWAQEVDWDNRNHPRSDWYPIRAYTAFDFPGRGAAHSDMRWHWWHFDSLSYNANTNSAARLYRLKNDGFETHVSHERGNYDYLMGCDLDTSHPDVEDNLRWWARWFVDATGVNGFRIDAVKHIRSTFFRDWMNHLRVHFSQRELFAVGEYWSADVDHLHAYLAATQGVMSLFDVALHDRFFQAARAGANYDLRTIFHRTLVAEQPAKAVTFVDNHDTQPCQSLESWVEPWFKPLAYALTLLRKGGYPCVFAGDLAESDYTDKGRYVKLWDHSFLIDRFLTARRDYNFGDQHDYFDHPNTVGWTRLGTHAHPGAMAVVLTNGAPGHKWMNTFRPNATFRDHTNHIPHTVTANPDGWADFPCPAGSVSVWLQN